MRPDRAAGLYTPSITADVVNNNPRLAWAPVPMAQYYRIHRRISGPTVPEWQSWGTVGPSPYIDYSTNVTSFYGYNQYHHTNTMVSYWVAALDADGFETFIQTFATFIPFAGPIPD